ncbi:MAG: wax ester/triacylglycerol synthase family O-acyltransferase [Candidatus Korobacteraceae bacterium]
MTNGAGNNSFSFGDALFLHVERPGQPLNIAGVSVFEGEIKLTACRAFIESKLPLVPRYRQRVVPASFDLGLPHWEVDPQFDIRNHIRAVRLKHGTEDELKALAGKIVSESLDRQRPLWDFTLARLQGGRTGLIVRIHHCMADGIAGVGVMNVIMDTTPTPPPIARKKQPVEPPPQPKDAGAAILDGLAKSYLSLVNGAAALHSGLLNMAQEAVANPAEAPSELLRVLSELAAPAEPLPFNVVCTGPQKFAWTDVPLADIKAIKNACGGTVNDVVLTVVTLAFGRYARQRGVKLDGRSLRIVIPVNVRGNGEATELGNQISFVPVPLPLDLLDPVKLLAVVTERVEFLKRARAAEFVGLFGGLLSTLPNAFWKNIGPVVSQLPLSLCNLICTNVPGPQTPLYLMGHKMLSWYPWVPIGGLMGINCAILTYNGTAYFGFTGDVNAAPDLERLEKFVDQSFAELRAASAAAISTNVGGAKPQRQRRARPNAKIPVAKNAATLQRPRKREPGSAKIPVASVEAPDFSPVKEAAENPGL